MFETKAYTYKLYIAIELLSLDTGKMVYEQSRTPLIHYQNEIHTTSIKRFMRQANLALFPIKMNSHVFEVKVYALN